MSQQPVGIIIDKLLSDEDLRIRLVVDRMETLAELYLRGVELRPDEIDLFCRADARIDRWAPRAVVMPVLFTIVLFLAALVVIYVGDEYVSPAGGERSVFAPRTY
jgi:hypothetical protein